MGRTSKSEISVILCLALAVTMLPLEISAHSQEAPPDETFRDADPEGPSEEQREPAMYTTPVFRSPSGKFQFHFYRNSVTGAVNYYGSHVKFVGGG